MEHLTPAGDSTPAGWIVAAVVDFGQSVLSLVPAGFAAYVRVFHPAYRITGAETTAAVTWAEIAAANGARPHAAMQLSALTGGYKRVQPGVFDGPPEQGSLPPKLTAPLAASLSRHTTTPDRCWFAIWNGFGGTPAEVRSAPTFNLPHREYHLMVGSVRAASDGLLDPPWRQSANVWWPDDRAWCVATEIDLDSTYIGCEEACREEILALAELEALPIDPAAGISFSSDLVNPLE